MVDFEIFLFSHDTGYASAALKAGVSGVVVDWEWVGKDARQKGYDTEVNHGQAADCAGHAGRCDRSACSAGSTISQNCARSRSAGRWLPEPMKSGCRWFATSGTSKRASTSSTGASDLASSSRRKRHSGLAARFPPCRSPHLYIGLNDLQIDQGRAQPFEALVDGTVDAFRDTYDGALAFGGVTLPKLGDPLPQALLLGAMARLGCRFGVARRSFRRDVPMIQLAESIDTIRRRFSVLSRRSALEVAADHDALRRMVQAIRPVAAV